MPHIHELYDFTVSAFILHPTEKKICLHMHKKLGKWLQPGGHIELNEDPIQALTHELEEEAGLQKTDYEIIQRVNRPNARGNESLPIPFNFNVHDFSETHKHIDLEYLVKSKTVKLNPDKNESQQIQWFSQEEIHVLSAKDELMDATLDICDWIFDNWV